MFPTINSSIGADNDLVSVMNGVRTLSSAANFAAEAPPKKTPLNTDHIGAFLDYFQRFTRLWGVLTAIVLCGIGIDLAFHKHNCGYYFIGGATALLFLEITWAITLFLRLCVRNESRVYRFWSAAAWLEGWKKGVLYGPLGALPIIWPHKLWLSYVAAGQLIALSVFHLMLTFKERRRIQEQRLLHGDFDSLESSRLEEVTEVLDDGLPEPIPGSSHSLSDSLLEQEAIIEI